MPKKIPLSKPCIGIEEIKAVEEVLRSGWLAHGPKNREFENLIKNFFGVEEAIVVNSGASALLLSLLALNIKKEVILPSFTMSASANAVVLAGATPVFAEVKLSTGNLDSAKLEEKITEKTEAIMPVHYAGQPCNMDEILSVARKYNLKIVEDSAEAIGVKYKNKYAGTSGDTGCFSFWATKNITTGEGGAVITNNTKLAKTIRTLMAHGIASSTLDRESSKRPWQRDAIEAGYNMRMSDINAALGLEQFKKLAVLNNLRREKARYLTQKLQGVSKVIPLRPDRLEDHVYQMYVVRVLGGLKRDDLVLALREMGIGASVHFDPPVHKQTYYKKHFVSTSLPITEELSNTVITLPLYPDIDFEDLDYIATSIKKVVENKS